MSELKFAKVWGLCADSYTLSPLQSSSFRSGSLLSSSCKRPRSLCFALTGNYSRLAHGGCCYKPGVQHGRNPRHVARIWKNHCAKGLLGKVFFDDPMLSYLQCFDLLLLLMLVSKIEKRDSLVSLRRHAPLRVTLLLLGPEPLLRPLAWRFSSVRVHACANVRVSG